jgi:hypothetical protein
MGLFGINIDFCGKKCECKRRCKGYFPEQPDLERGCKNACKGNSDLTRHDYLCSGEYVDQGQYMLSYGHDPCPNSGPAMEDILDPSNSYEKQRQNLEDMGPIYAGVGVLILVGLVLLYRSIG